MVLPAGTELADGWPEAVLTHLGHMQAGDLSMPVADGAPVVLRRV